MDLYPIKKMIQDEKRKFPYRYEQDSSRKEYSLRKTSRYPANKEEFLRIFYSHEATSTRFDQKSTICWTRKQEERLNEMLTISALRGEGGKDTGRSPLSNGQTLIVLQPVENKPQEQNQSLSIRPKKRSEGLSRDEESVNFTSRSREETKASEMERTGYDSFRKLLAPVRIRKHDSCSRLLTKLKDMNTTGGLNSYRTKGIRLLSEENQSLRTHRNMTEVNNDTVLARTGIEKGFSSNREKANVLEGLEGIFFTDLKESNKVKTPRALAIEKLTTSPYSKGAIRLTLRKRESDGLHGLARNERDILEDKILMSHLGSPYTKTLPFKRPINVSVLDKRKLMLKELETKAEILRNIKKINDEIKKGVVPVGLMFHQKNELSHMGKEISEGKRDSHVKEQPTRTRRAKLSQLSK